MSSDMQLLCRQVLVHLMMQEPSLPLQTWSDGAEGAYFPPLQASYAHLKGREAAAAAAAAAARVVSAPSRALALHLDGAVLVLHAHLPLRAPACNHTEL